jgi:membrane protein DedA with SNARE-associated domain
MTAASSSATEALALFLVPLLHEDVAIVAAALLIAAHRLSLGVAVPSLYGGMISRDLLLYGLGAFARRSSKARELLISPRIQHLARWVRGRMVRVIVIARVVPGLMFPAYIACGWFGLSFKRYAAVTIAVTAVYLPVVLTFGTLFGRLALDRVGNWAWIGLALPLIFIAASRLPGLWRKTVTGSVSSD